jgi:protein-disulfide isomerase
MRQTRLWIGALGLVVSAVLIAACGGGDDGEQSAAAQQSVDAQQTEQVEQAEPEARVQVIRERASLGSPDAPVVIQEYSDFL